MPATLIKNALIVTMNEQREILDGNLLVAGDRIKAIGREEFAADLVIEAQGQVLIPGLIQTHVHLCQAILQIGRAHV